MLERPPTCADCIMPSEGCEGFSLPEGTGSLSVLGLGEALGSHEAADGLPFRPWAQAGSVLERAIQRSGFTRQQFRLYNVMACRPPRDFLEGAPYEVAALEHCKQYWQQVVKEMQPRVIVTLGNVPTRVLTGLAGEKLSISYLRGYCIPTQWGLVLPTYHPSFIARGNSNLFGVLCHDLQQAVTVSKLEQEEADGYARDYEAAMDDAHSSYCLDPSESDVRNFIQQAEAHPELYLAYDIETPESHYIDEDERETAAETIESAQFSLGRGTGIFLDWRRHGMAIRKLLALLNPKLGFNNWKFDDPKLRQWDCIINGENHDLMWAWHHLQPDLPAPLQFVSSFYGWKFPWKHLASSEPEFYGVCDVDSLHYIAPKIFDDLRARQIWRGYEQHVLHLEPVLVEISRRGMPVDDAGLREYQAELEQQREQIEQQMRGLVPEELLNSDPKQGYKSVPKQVQEATSNYNNLNLLPNDKQALEGETEMRYIERRTGMKLRAFGSAQKLNILTGEMEPLTMRWCKLLPFKPSSDQLIRYMKFRKHIVPRNFKTGKETTEAKQLERLAKQTSDPLYKLVIEHRNMTTMLKNFLVNWQPGVDGKVHSTFFYAPGTGQLSSRRPNVQNASKPDGSGSPKDKLAIKFRKMIQAPEGRKVVEIDWRSFHALTTGFEAKDADYMRLARLDIHAYVTAHLEKLKDASRCLSWPDDQLSEFLSQVKREHRFIRDKKAKPAILGYGFGLRERHFYEMNQESFDSLKEARYVLHLLDGLFPRCAKWRKDITMQAHRQSFLQSRHGYLRYFFDVYHWDSKRRMMVPGDDHEAAIAFLPANDAHGHLKDVILKLREREWDELYSLSNTIHDSLIFFPESGRVAECIANVGQLMEEPSNILVDPQVAPEGLVCRVSASVGEDWCSMQEV